MTQPQSHPFSTFGIITTQYAATLPGAVTDRAVLHELQLTLQQTRSDANVLAQRVLSACEEGPGKSTKDPRGTFISAARESARSTTDPMKRLPSALAERAAEAHGRFRHALAEWARTTVDRLAAPEDNAHLAAALATQGLRVSLAAEIPMLRQNVERKEAAMQTAEATLRALSGDIEASILARTEGATSRIPPAVLNFSKFFGISAGIVFFISLLALDWGTAAMVATGTGLLVALLAHWNRALEADTISRRPFAVLDDKFIALANDATALETARQCFEQTDAVLQLIQCIKDPQTLIDAFSMALRTIEGRIRAYPRDTYTSPAPDMILIDGQDLADALWQRRLPFWSTTGFNETLAATSGCSTVDALLRDHPSDAVTPLQAAARAAMREVTLTETITVLFQLENGNQQFNGVLRSQIINLFRLLRIQESKAQLRPAACPALFHAIVPEQLVEILNPTLDTVFSKLALDIFPTQDDELRLSFETFNWRNEERSDHAYAARSLARHNATAQAERWSCISSLVSSTPSPNGHPRAGASLEKELAPLGFASARTNSLSASSASRQASIQGEPRDQHAHLRQETCSCKSPIQESQNSTVLL